VSDTTSDGDRLPQTKRGDRATPQEMTTSPKLVISDRFLARQKAASGQAETKNGDENIIMIGDNFDPKRTSANKSETSSATQASQYTSNLESERKRMVEE